MERYEKWGCYRIGKIQKRLFQQAVKDASFVAAEATTHKIGHSPEENVANLNWVK